MNKYNVNLTLKSPLSHNDEQSLSTTTVQPEYLTQHDPYIHYTTESEVY